MEDGRTNLSSENLVILNETAGSLASSSLRDTDYKLRRHSRFCLSGRTLHEIVNLAKQYLDLNATSAKFIRDENKTIKADGNCEQAAT